jgi:hypothetical protein
MSSEALQMDLRRVTVVFRRVFEADLLVFRQVTPDPRPTTWVRRDPHRGSRRLGSVPP